MSISTGIPVTIGNKQKSQYIFSPVCIARQYQVKMSSNERCGTRWTLQIFVSMASCQKLLLQNQKEIWLTGPSRTPLSFYRDPNLCFLTWKWKNINYWRLRPNLQNITVYEGESNENLKNLMYLSHNLLNTKGTQWLIFLCNLHCVPYKCSSTSEVHGYL
jgi:hypothetical protein